MSRAGRMQPESRSVCVFLPSREQLSLAVGVSGQQALLAPVVLPKAWCWSADRKAISQLRVIGASFSNQTASTHLQSALEVPAVFLDRGSVPSALFLLLPHFYSLSGFAADNNLANFKKLNLKCLDGLASVPNT